ncbi:MAG: ABC transporter ATP-binding protein [Thermoanaerobaculia bacterium]
MSELEHLEIQETRGYDARLMRRLLGYVGPHLGLAVSAVALIIVSSILQLVGPLVTAVALDLFIRPAAGGAEPSAVSRTVAEALAVRGIELAPHEGLAAIGAVYLLSLGLTFCVLYLQGLIMQFMGQYIMYDLRIEIFAKLQRLPVSFFDRTPVGRLVTRVTNDIDALNELFTAGLVSIFGDVFLLGGIVCVLFWFNWKLALVTFAILPLLFLLTFWFKLRARQSYRDVRVRLAAINSFLQENITGMSIVQLFNRERAALAEFKEINADHRDANVRAIFYYAVYFPSVELITALGIALVLWYGGGQVIAGALSLGALVAFLQYAQRFYQPLADLSEKYNILQAAMAASERVFELVDHDPEIQSPTGAHNPGSVDGEIEFRNVEFSYNPGEPVLHDVSFRVAPGETVAVVGHTGAGKSTLASLVQRFYDVDSGAVLVDGADVRRWQLPRLRTAVGVVLQDVFLFSGTVGENIRLGNPEIDDQRLRWAAREVHALEFIESLQDGFDAVVRERGAGLSVGQKQLIAFARALAFDPSILILDEATSSIDTETERLIQLGLETLLADRTSLVIAHRLSTIRRADRILVLHKGHLCEQGSHDELMELGGIYYRLHLLQHGEAA